MTPDVPSVLLQLAAVLTRNAAPDAPPAERAADLGLSAMLLAIAAEVWDGAAHRLVEENRALAALLDDHAAETDFRVSALEVENRRLRNRLIEAQIAAEGAGDAARQDAIWAELRASTERRKLSISLV